MGREQGLVGAGVTDGATPDRMARAHERMLADRTLQFDFPAITPPRPPAWLKVVGEVLEAIAPLLGYLFWIAVAAGVGLILFMIVREILTRTGVVAAPARREMIAELDLRPTAEQARVLLADADALAADGRFAEAAHLLLLRRVQDIRDQRPGLVQPSLTSRDIAALPELPDGARGAFAAIAVVVERSFFGGRDVGADDWSLCRRTYEAFALDGAPA